MEDVELYAFAVVRSLVDPLPAEALVEPLILGEGPWKKDTKELPLLACLGVTIEAAWPLCDSVESV